jgi:hypothetical protein
MTTISARRFLLAFAGTFLGIVALLSAHSILVDPFGMWGTRIAPEKGYEKFGRVRVASDRVVKGLMLSRDRYDMLLIGSSRALFGFDRAHPAFAGRRVYNGAFIGATAPENASVLAYALARQSGLKDALIGLDLFAFARLKAFGDYDQSAFAGASLAAGYASRVLSKDALDGSTRFWQSLRGRAVARMSLDGFQQPEPEWLRHRRKLFTRIVGVGTSDCGAPEEVVARLAQGMDNFAKIARQAKARGVNLHFYLSPIHVWAHALEDAAGRTGVHEAFRRMARRMVDELAAAPGAGSVALWDFDGLDAVTTEDVPAEGSSAETRYFWEPSHFRTPVGDAILAAMLGGPGRIDGFGAQLVAADMEAGIVATRARLADWAASHPEDAAMLRARAAIPRVCRDGVFQGAP